MHEWYHSWWSRHRKMSKKQIQEMIKNMQKSNMIDKRSVQYHEQEEKEAENILKKLDENS